MFSKGVDFFDVFSSLPFRQVEDLAILEVIMCHSLAELRCGAVGESQLECFRVMLACGDLGDGAMAEPADIDANALAECLCALSFSAPSNWQRVAMQPAPAIETLFASCPSDNDHKAPAASASTTPAPIA